MGKKTTEGGNFVNCPECAQPVNARGFSGHMRFKHGVVMNQKEVFKSAKSKATSVEEGARLFELMDSLEECRKRKVRVEEMDDSPIIPLFRRDEAAAAVRRGLEIQEANILAELKSLGYGEPPEDS